MIDEKRIKRFIEGAKEALKEVDDPTFTFPMNILSAYELATSIEELLKAQEPGWISVKDRLPETNDEVLTTYLYDDKPNIRYVESAGYFDDGEDEGHWYSIWDEHTIGPVRKTRIAWMPMPKPYKPSEDDKNGKND